MKKIILLEHQPNDLISLRNVISSKIQDCEILSLHAENNIDRLNQEDADLLVLHACQDYNYMSWYEKYCRIGKPVVVVSTDKLMDIPEGIEGKIIKIDQVEKSGLFISLILKLLESNNFTDDSLKSRLDKKIKQPISVENMFKTDRSWDVKNEFGNHEYYLEKAQEMGKIGTWELDIIHDHLVWTDTNYKIFGIPKGTSLNLEKFLSCVHPDDRNYVYSKWYAALNHEPYNIEHRLIDHGVVKWVTEKADIEFDDHGIPLRAVGFTQDITERKMAEAELAHTQRKFYEIFSKNRDGFVILLLSGEILEINPAFAEMLGYTISELKKKSFWELSSKKKFKKEVKKQRENLLTRGYTDLFEKEYFRKNGEVFPVQVQAYVLDKTTELQETQIAVFIRDISLQKKIEAEKIQAEATIKENSRMLKFQNEELLSLMSKGVCLKPGLKQAIEEITMVCSKIVKSGRVSVWWYNDDYEQKCCFTAYDRDLKKHSSGEILKCSRVKSYAKEHIAGRVIRVEDVSKDPRTQKIPDDYFKKYNIKSLLDAPVWIGGKVGGLLSFEETGKQRKWTQEDERLITSMATMVSLAYEIYQRRNTEQELIKHRDNLEAMIRERTAQLELKNLELQKINSELERFNNLFIDREFRIKELKERIKELGGNIIGKN